MSEEKTKVNRHPSPLPSALIYYYQNYISRELYDGLTSKMSRPSSPVEFRVLGNYAWVWVAQRLLTRASPAKDKASRRFARNDRIAYSGMLPCFARLASRLFSRARRDSDLPHSSIHVDLFTGNVRGVGGRQEGNHARHFFRPARSLHGDESDNFTQAFLYGLLRQSQTFEDGCQDGARANRVHTNSPIHKLGSRGPRQGS